MGSKRKQRRPPHGSARHWKQTDHKPKGLPTLPAKPEVTAGLKT